MHICGMGGPCVRMHHTPACLEIHHRWTYKGQVHPHQSTRPVETGMRYECLLKHSSLALCVDGKGKGGGVQSKRELGL